MTIFCYCPLLFLSSLLLLYSSLAGAQQPRPHGLQFETPMSFPPSAFDFFHPNPAMVPVASTCNSFPNIPSSFKARADQVHESTVRSAPRIGGGSPGAGGVSALVLGVVFMVLVAIGGVSYVVLKRGKNSNKGCSTILPKV